MGLDARKPVFGDIISNLATGEINIFWPVNVAEETGLSLVLSETPKTGFIVSWPNTFISKGQNNFTIKRGF